MQDFIFSNKCEIHFGRLSEKHIAECVKKFSGTKVLLHFGGGSIIKTGLHERVKNALVSAGLVVVELGGVRPNPSKGLSFSGIDLAKSECVDFVLAVGGGSVIDSAKCIAAGAKFCGTPLEFWEKHYIKREEVPDTLPVGAVLTIPAAGSECSKNSVIRDEETGMKYSFGSSDLTRPKFAFINPEYCMSLPPEQIANGASDIFAHLFERFFADDSVQNTITTDKLLIGAMKAVIEIAPKVYANIKDYDSLADLCLVGTLAHNDMLNMGRGGGCWASHNIEMAFLSGLKDIAHGRGLAIVMPAYLKHMQTKKPHRVEQFIKEVISINKLKGFFKSLDLPTSLSDMDFSADEIKGLVKTTFPPKVKLGGYGQLNIKDIEQIIEIAR